MVTGRGVRLRLTDISKPLVEMRCPVFEKINRTSGSAGNEGAAFGVMESEKGEDEAVRWTSNQAVFAVVKRVAGLWRRSEGR